MFMSEKGKYLHIILDMGDIVEAHILGVGGWICSYLQKAILHSCCDTGGLHHIQEAKLGTVESATDKSPIRNYTCTISSNSQTSVEAFDLMRKFS
jgi:hypothetical protein